MGVACDGGAGSHACSATTVVAESGLRYRDLRCGSGHAAEGGDTVTVAFTTELDDALVEQADASDAYPLRPAAESFTFLLGAGQVILGWDEGIRGMKAGGARTLVVPPELAFGSAGVEGLVAPGATLTFEIELLDIERP
ncbi:MAG: FKBP-type peptidyl-prolyl cis-trans isomerase [Actinomycetota bacterium]